MKKFYDTCSLLELQSAILEDDFLISNISLTELENIKTSTTKDEEIKYRARQVLHLLHENEDKYKVIIYIEDYDALLKKHMLPITNDSKIIISALVGFERECGLDEGIFITHDLACKT